MIVHLNQKLGEENGPLQFANQNISILGQVSSSKKTFESSSRAEINRGELSLRC